MTPIKRGRPMDNHDNRRDDVVSFDLGGPTCK